jgi:hypothetical protein
MPRLLAAFIALTALAFGLLALGCGDRTTSRETGELDCSQAGSPDDEIDCLLDHILLTKDEMPSNWTLDQGSFARGRVSGVGCGNLPMPGVVGIAASIFTTVSGDEHPEVIQETVWGV